MSKKSKIDDFVAGLLDFKPDSQLKVLSVTENRSNHAKIAAAGEKSITRGFRKVGILTDQTKGIVVRIFENEEKDCFQLYFISDDTRSLQYTILSTADILKYFLVTKSRCATIPKSSDIDPFKDRLNITYSKAQFVLDLSVESNTVVVSFPDYGEIKIKYEYNPENHRLHFRRLHNKTESGGAFSKLLVVGKNKRNGEEIARLVTIRNGSAEVQLLEEIEKVIQVCLYE